MRLLKILLLFLVVASCAYGGPLPRFLTDVSFQTYLALKADITDVAGINGSSTQDFNAQALTVTGTATAAVFKPTGMPEVQATIGGTQTVGNALTVQASFTTELKDALGEFADSTFTCQRRGLFRVSASIYWAANATGYRQIEITKNGSTTAPRALFTLPGSAAVEQTQTVHVELRLVPGDTIDVTVYQSSGGDLNINGSNITWLSIVQLQAE